MRRVSAFLVPDPHAPQLRGVWQVAVRLGTHLSVQQFPLEPDIVAERAHRHAARPTNPGPIALQPMSADAIAGAAREVQLTVQDADGKVFLPRQIHLEEVRLEPAHYESALRECPREALVSGSVWWVFVSDLSESAAPAT